MGTHKRGIEFQNKIQDPKDLSAGCIICVNDAPVTLFLREQELTTVSSMEAESIAMCTAMREPLWVHRLVKDIVTGFGVECNGHTTMHSTAFEDNEGVMHLAKRPDMTP